MSKTIQIFIFTTLLSLGLFQQSRAQTNCEVNFQIQNASEVLIKCIGETVNLQATTGTNISNYKWYIEGDPNPLSTSSNLGILYGGNYIVTASSNTGCFLSDTLYVVDFEKPSVNLGNDISVCISDPLILTDPNADPNMMSFLWSTGATTPSIEVNSTGTYWVKVTNTFGCSDYDTVQVDINPKPELTLGSDRLICLGKSTTLGAILLKQGTPPYTYKWLENNTLSNTTIPNPIATPTQLTTYTVIVTDGKGCSDTSSINVNVGGALSSAVMFADTTVCASSSVQLKANASGGTPFNNSNAYYYTWSPASGLVGSNTATPVASPQSTTTYTVTVRDSAGCTSTSSVTINVPQFTSSIVSPEGNELCGAKPIQLNSTITGGQGPYTYSWSPAANFNNPTIANPIATPNNTLETKFLLQVTDSRGCSIRDSITIRVSTPPSVKVTPIQNSAVCVGNSITLGATASGTGQLSFNWSPVDSSLTSANTATPVFRAPHDATGTKTFYVSVTNEKGCISNTDSIVIYFLDAPRVELGSTDTFLCPGESIKLINHFATTGTYKWFDLANGQIVSTNPEFITGNTGSYKLQVTNDATGCINSDIINVTYSSKPVDVYIISPDSAFNDSTITLTATAEGTDLHYSWTTTGKGELLNSNTDTVEYKPSAFDTSYVTFTLKVFNPCDSIIITKDIFFQKAPTTEHILFVPRFFSPLASDPQNTSLRIFGVNISEINFAFRVFNRWGEVVYETTDLNEALTNGWNGNTNKNKDSGSNGIYSYIVKGTYTDGTPFTQTGTSTLIR